MGGRALSRLAPAARFGVGFLGVAYFLDQAQTLLSDAQFTWAERRIAALTAVTVVIGFGLAGWVAGTILKVAAGLLELLADQAEASWRTVDLMEVHVVPTLGRIAARLDVETANASPNASPAPSASTEPRRLETGRVQALTGELAEARAEEDVDRALDLRDELTRYLRGDALRRLDRELARWTRGLIEAKLKASEVDWEVARWAARAVDSLGDEPDAVAIRSALPEIRRRAGLCRVCGRAVAGGKDVCGRCATQSAGKEPR